MNKTVSSAFHLLESPVQQWVWQQQWTSLRDIQENSIPPILRRESDVIISAATAGGKTEAAFLPILTHLLRYPKPGYQVLYISPLKALINDQARRLEEMVRGLPVQVIPWHGDINNDRKQKSLKVPQGIVIITPESLESFFVNRKQHLTAAFSGLDYIVIDELHAFIGTERGKQLQSLLCRVERISNRRIPRIALSATFSDYEVVKEFLRNDGGLPCVVPSAGDSNHEIKILLKEYTEQKEEEISVMEKIWEEIYQKFRGSNNLLFANSRQRVEETATWLTERSEQEGVPNEFRVHHGSLAKNERESVERELQQGLYPVTAVCTSTLELGVDIGKVQAIGQIGAANSVAGLRQRLGRSGRRGEPSILRIYSIDSENDTLHSNLKAGLFQNVAVIQLLIEKRYETPAASCYHFSTLIQQILSLLCQYGGFQPREAWVYLCEQGAFRNVTASLFLELLKALGEADVVSQTHSGEIVIGLAGERIVRSQNFYVAFQTSLEYTLIDREKSKPIGSLQYIPLVGEFVILGGRKWKVVSFEEKARKVFVTKVKYGEKPSFMSDTQEVDRLIVEKMKEIYAAEDIYPYLDIIGRKCLETGRRFFQGHHLDKVSLFTYGGQTFLMTWAGVKINHTIALWLASLDGVMRSHDLLGVQGVSVELLERLKGTKKPEAAALAALITNRRQKERQKYDYLLSEGLLNVEYGRSSLDVDGAWEVVQGLI